MNNHHILKLYLILSILGAILFTSCATKEVKITIDQEENVCQRMMGLGTIKTKWESTSTFTCVTTNDLPKDGFRVFELQPSLLETTLDPHNYALHQVYLQDWLNDWFIPQMGWSAQPDTVMTHFLKKGGVVLEARFAPQTLLRLPPLKNLPKENTHPAVLTMGFHGKYFAATLVSLPLDSTNTANKSLKKELTKNSDNADSSQTLVNPDEEYLPLWLRKR